MPLSEREQELLEQMERALYEEDPRFATQLRAGAAGYAKRRRYLLAALVVAVGLAAVVAAVVLENVPLGVVGFVVMVAGGVYGVSPEKPRLVAVRPDGSVRHPAGTALGRGARPAPQRGASPRSVRSGTFMERLEQRWEERRERGEM